MLTTWGTKYLTVNVVFSKNLPIYFDVRKYLLKSKGLILQTQRYLDTRQLLKTTT